MSDFLSRAHEAAKHEARKLYLNASMARQLREEDFAEGFTTAVSRLPSEEEIADVICSEQRHTGDRECEYDHATARAVRELIEKKMLGGGDAQTVGITEKLP